MINNATAASLAPASGLEGIRVWLAAQGVKGPGGPRKPRTEKYIHQTST